MWINRYYICFTKFLSDGREESLISEVHLLINTIKNWAPIEKKSILKKLKCTSHIKSELQKQYIKTSSEVHDAVSSRRWPNYTFWSYYSPGANDDTSSFCLKSCLNKMPYLIGFLEPPLAERNRYKELMTLALENGIIDIIQIEEPTTKNTISGKPNWIYLKEKIKLIKILLWVQMQDRTLGETSIVYEFAQRVGEVLLPITPQITLTRINYLDLSSLEKIELKTELERLEIAEEQMMNRFFKKYDQILLDTWGEKKFIENLAPLEVSLEEWLKAVSIEQLRHTRL